MENVPPTFFNYFVEGRHIQKVDIHVSVRLYKKLTLHTQAYIAYTLQTHIHRCVWGIPKHVGLQSST